MSDSLKCYTDGPIDRDRHIAYVQTNWKLNLELPLWNSLWNSNILSCSENSNWSDEFNEILNRFVDKFWSSLVRNANFASFQPIDSPVNYPFLSLSIQERWLEFQEGVWTSWQIIANSARSVNISQWHSSMHMMQDDFQCLNRRVERVLRNPFVKWKKTKQSESPNLGDEHRRNWYAKQWNVNGFNGTEP